MLIIVGGAEDAEAKEAVAILGPGRAALMTARDLSRPGWHLAGIPLQAGTVVAARERLPTDAITGVLVRRMAVYPQELTHVTEGDRDYVASEMTAALTWWLGATPVPVLNRPGGAVLCGPGWQSERWLARAVTLGIPVLPRRHEVPARCPAPLTPLVQAVVVGETVLGEVSDELADRARRLARVAEVTLLCAVFDGSGADARLADAHTLPRLTAEVVEAIGHHIGLA